MAAGSTTIVSPPPVAKSPRGAEPQRQLFSRSSGRDKWETSLRGAEVPENGTASDEEVFDDTKRKFFRRPQPVSPRSGSQDEIRAVSSPVKSKTTVLGGNYDEISTSILSMRRVGKVPFFLVATRRKGERDLVIAPRSIPEFRDLHSQLVKLYGEVVVPDLGVKKVGAGSDKDVQLQLEAFLTMLVNYEQLAESQPLRKFLDPTVNPACFTLTEILSATKVGKLQFMTSAQRTWRPVVVVLLNHLYVYRTEEDASPLDILMLEWVTIELVPKAESGPSYVFKVCDLLMERELFFGVESTKEVTEWILAIREAKTNNKQDNFWVKGHLEGRADVGASQQRPRVSIESEKGLSLWLQWLEKDLKGESGTVDPRTIALKSTSSKMDLGTPLPIDYSDLSPKTILERVKDDGSCQLIAASRERLLMILMDPSFNDPQFPEFFILVYPLFVDLPQLFLTIRQRFLSETDFMIRNRCAHLVQLLIEKHTLDFLRDERLSLKAIEFVTTSIEPHFHTIGWLIRETIESFSSQLSLSKNFFKSSPKPLLPDMYHLHTFDFIDLHPLEVARQLTILEYGLFASIELKELLNQAWDSETKETSAPNVTQTIRRFNQMSGWITSLIVKITPLKPRVALLKRFIDIADECLKLDNFNSVLEIVSGLQTTSVRRLTETFEQLSDETKQTYQNLRDFLETRKNWERYRTRLNSVTGPCVPYLGIHLTDLTMIAEKFRKKVPHPDFPDVTLLNWERSSRVAEVLGLIKRLQVKRYRLHAVPYFQEYLSRLDQLSEDECMKLSQEIQPKK